MSHLSSLSQKKVINNFPGDNFVYLFLNTESSPREVASDILFGILLKLRRIAL